MSGLSPKCRFYQTDGSQITAQALGMQVSGADRTHGVESFVTLFPGPLDPPVPNQSLHPRAIDAETICAIHDGDGGNDPCRLKSRYSGMRGSVRLSHTVATNHFFKRSMNGCRDCRSFCVSSTVTMIKVGGTNNLYPRKFSILFI